MEFVLLFVLVYALCNLWLHRIIFKTGPFPIYGEQSSQPMKEGATFITSVTGDDIAKP